MSNKRLENAEESESVDLTMEELDKQDDERNQSVEADVSMIIYHSIDSEDDFLADVKKPTNFIPFIHDEEDADKIEENKRETPQTVKQSPSYNSMTSNQARPQVYDDYTSSVNLLKKGF